MFAGVDFPSKFTEDNFTSRRTTGHNMNDPESLISGKELEQGFSYSNSSRNWSREEQYLQAVRGDISWDEVLKTAPRVFRTQNGKMKFIFTVELPGVGENEQEAWLDAIESFNQDPGVATARTIEGK